MKPCIRHFLALLLCLVFALSLLPGAALAAELPEEQDAQTEGGLPQAKGDDPAAGDDTAGPDGKPTVDGLTTVDLPPVGDAPAAVDEQGGDDEPGGDEPGDEPAAGWYLPVTVGGTDYEIEFLMDWGNGRIGPYGESGGSDYKPFDDMDFSMTLGFGVVTRRNPDDEWGERILADDAIQAMITDPTFRFEGQNEDGAAGDSNWTFTPDPESREVCLSAPHGEGFDGMLTVSFRFDGEAHELSARVFFLRSEAYLGFLPVEGEEQYSLFLRPDSALSGRFLLHRWDSGSRQYTSEAVSAADAGFLHTEGPVTLSWDSEDPTLATLSPSTEEGFFQITYRYQDEQGYIPFEAWIQGNIRAEDQPHDEGEHCVIVTVDGTDYEIEFLMDWGNGRIGPYGESGGSDYKPFDDMDFSMTLGFGVVTRSDPDDEWSERILADDAIQAMITDPTFRFEGQNEDGAAGDSNWTFTPDPESREVCLSAPHGKGFDGMLTVSFRFDGEAHELSARVFFLRSEAYLGFLPVDGEEQYSLFLRPDSELSGRFLLHRWDSGSRQYTSEAVSAADAGFLHTEGPVALSWDSEDPTLATLSPSTEEGFFQITYRYQDEQGYIPFEAWIQGNIRAEDQPHDEGEHCVIVTVDGTDYEIEFLMDWGGGSFGPCWGAGSEYRPDDQDGYSQTLSFAVVTRSDPDVEWSERILADEEIQAKITDLTFGFEGQNEDGVPGDSNWTFTPDPENRRVSFSAPRRMGFEGTLTAAFRFDGEDYTVRIPMFYLRCRYYLGFAVGEETLTNLQLPLDGSVSGSLVLYQWDDEGRSYGQRTLSSADSEALHPNGPVSLSWDPEEPSLVTVSSRAENPGPFNIRYDREDPQQGVSIHIGLEGWIGEGGPGAPWYIPIEGTEYEIMFLADWGDCYGPYSGGGDEYRPGSSNDFSSTLPFAVVTRSVPDDEGCSRIVADEDTQSRITELSFRFEGHNEDGGEDPNWSFTPDYDKRKVSFSAPCQKGFSGTLSADFLFDGEPYSISVPVNYLRCRYYLGFRTDGGDTLSFLQFRPDSSLSGSFLLYHWDAALGEYTEAVLSAAEAGNFSADPPLVELSWDPEDDTHVTIMPAGEQEGWFSIRYDYENWEDPDNIVQIHTDLSGEIGNSIIGEEYVSLSFKGETVTTGVGFIQSKSLRLGSTYGDSYTPGDGYTMQRSFVLGGLRYFMDQEKEVHATPEFFSRIESCSVELDVYSGTEPTLSVPVKQVYQDLDGAELWSFTLTSQPDAAFRVTMLVHFTYREDDGTLSEHDFRANAFFQATKDVNLDASDLDTADKLNDVLRSRAALEQYLYERGVSFSWEGTVKLNLPVAEYDKLIVCDVCDTGGGGMYGVALVGAADGGQTVLHGLKVRSGMNFLDRLSFTADESVLQRWNGESLICGVLCEGHPDGRPEDQPGSSIYSINACSFSGFDYAVRGTASGYPGTLVSCTLEDCDYGLYLDCPDLNAAGNSEVCWNIFRRCGDAVLIRRLPWTITSYIYRIHDNLFIDCGRASAGSDIHVEEAGTFFCYLNFYGYSDAELTPRRTAQLFAGENTRIIANPCRKTADLSDNSACWIDPALPTEILNNEASGMVIDGEAFAEESIRIDVVDLGENGLGLVGSWIFGGEEA